MMIFLCARRYCTMGEFFVLAQQPCSSDAGSLMSACVQEPGRCELKQILYTFPVHAFCSHLNVVADIEEAAILKLTCLSAAISCSSKRD